MDRARWEKVIELYHAASERELAGRSAFLANACEGDAALRSEVESLLRQNASQGDILERIAEDNRNWSPAAKLDALPMRLSVGSRLAHYEILALLGAGGMGEVYRARDLKLKREVAIKILPEEFSRDADRVSRFQREAEVLASLNHPNIAIIYDVQEANETRFLVLELVQGETLAERFQRGPIPVDEAVQIGRHICEALEAAHERGIIHRDLKPANVKITPDGKVKVLDFGLAKAMTGATAEAARSPAVPSGSAGMILGTAGYMSPEQTNGHSADQRSDIFSFGCVLYEMLSGRSAFQRGTVSETIAATLLSDVDLAALPANLNPNIRHLIRRCLEKNPKSRWHAFADLRLCLEDVTSIPVVLTTEPRQARSRSWKLAVALLLVAAVSSGSALVWLLRSPHDDAVAKFSFELPNQAFGRPHGHVLAISPDGKNIVYVSTSGPARRSGIQLYLRSLDNVEVHPIAGTGREDTDTPFFSPDGRWIAFHSNRDGKLKKLPISGGTPVVISDEKIGPLYGATWTETDDIYIGMGSRGILRVPASGGKLEPVLQMRPGELAHGPQLLGSGEWLLYTSLDAPPSTVDSSYWNKGRIVVQSLKSSEQKVLIDGGSDGRYAPSGHLLYAVGSTVRAVPFDLKTMTVRGDPVTVIEDVLRPRAFNTGAASFNFSANGSLVHASVSVTPVALVMIDRSGVRKPLNLPAGIYTHFRISPAGKHLIITNAGTASIFDLANESLRPLIGSHIRAMWSPDGQHIVFGSDRNGKSQLFRQPADGSGAAEPLTADFSIGQLSHEAWSPDGKAIIFNTGGGTVRELNTWWIVPADGSKKPEPLAGAPYMNGRFSPDGRWIAYNARAETAEAQIYVQAFPANGTKYQISTKGGHHPIWAPDGKRLYYVNANEIHSVDTETGPPFSFGKTTSLGIRVRALFGFNGAPYDVSPDGRYILAAQDPGPDGTSEEPTSRIHVTLNWLEELKRRVPAK